MGHIRIPNEYYRTPEFLEFSKTVKSRILEFIISHVVRAGGVGRKYIFDNHYVKGELVSRYSQEDMAEFFGTDQGNISRYISELEDMKLVRRRERWIHKTRILYYQVGRWSGTLGGKDYTETIYFYTMFDAYAQIAKEMRLTKKTALTKDELETLLSKLDPADMWYEDDKEYYTKRLDALNHM
jgi:hypothetical protein